MPLVKSGLGDFMRLSRVILVENPDVSMPAHTKGCERNLVIGTQVRSLRMSGPLGGAPGAPTVDHPLCHFVPRSDCSVWL
jgi:hypothetical protein